ncbi:Xaa-Pro dipeptidyl-peptidase [Winogradskyella aurantia]|uniref:Xaa-Pro dipeptidyl-peptidase n=1 Tax=Winogradskyella aurantia TaxID=1915063 RepID=A0A265UMV9_9FLAO|nr:Xaa-Pro dipeptidyl-peptidase [Winogradskyella aurantia]OZV66599.1 Xaa-Pro dipeptidyl-peptidase [Winogradskyella aurantia]
MKLSLKLRHLLIVITLMSAACVAQEPAQPIFKDGEAQIVDAFSNANKWIRHDLWVETDFDTDGDSTPDRMHVSVTRPEQTETEGLKLPVVYVSSPYFAGVAGDVPGIMWNVEHELGEIGPERVHPEVKRRGQRPIISNSHIKKWVPRGYIVVHSSSPGTGLSDGAPTIGGKNESMAPKFVIDWLCGRAKGYTERNGGDEVKAYWSTGKVGMTGTSYNGTIPLAAATTGVEGLEAIIPIAPNTSYYHYYRSNGLVRSPGGYLGEDIDVLYDFVHSGDEAKRPYNNKTVRDTEMKNDMDRETGDYNDFWAGRDYLNQMDNMKAALLMSHGFNDWNVMPEHSYRIYNAAREKGLPAMIYYHQFGHGGPPPMSMMNKWFTKYLHGVDNGVENEENKAYIVREYDDMDKPTAYRDYPNPKAEPVTLFLNDGGNTSGSLSTKQNRKLSRETLVDDVSFSGEDLATAEKSTHRLLYLTNVLKEDLHISGIPKVSITIASSKPAANLSVWLVALPWEEGKAVRITDNVITRGWADPKNYKSLRDEEALIPGQFYTIDFELQPDDQIIKAGQQIGFMIFSSDKEYTLHPKPGTVLTLDLNKTSLTLPIVGGKETYKKVTD